MSIVMEMLMIPTTDRPTDGKRALINGDAKMAVRRPQPSGSLFFSSPFRLCGKRVLKAFRLVRRLFLLSIFRRFHFCSSCFLLFEEAHNLLLHSHLRP